MNYLLFALLGIFGIFQSAVLGATEERMPVVSTRWLAEHLGATHLVVLDIRAKSRYGHIRTAVNLPAPWAFSKDGTLRNAD
jgi:3-mercaptopyruvate sulfurtransferase SseA